MGFDSPNALVLNEPKVKTVAVDTKKLYRISFLAESLTRSIHSSGHLPREDKIAMLARLRTIRTLVQGELQLTFFSPAQRER